MDTGAPQSVIGRKELNRIFNKNGIHDVRIIPSNKSFRFVDTSFKYLGRVQIELETPLVALTVQVCLDIVQVDIPALLEMDVLDKEVLTPCLISNRLGKRRKCKTGSKQEVFIDEWYRPIHPSRSNHLYVGMRFGTRAYFKKAQLSRLHRNFFHPSVSKLFNLIKRARPEHATEETRRILEDIAR